MTHPARDDFLDNLFWQDGTPDRVTSGMAVELEDGSKYLVGEVNADGGTCNCCEVEYQWERTIVRWAYVYEG